MSKKSKAASKEKRLNKKRAIKQANKARYLAMKISGQNTKSKRATKQSRKNRLANRPDHTNGNCGNLGCKKCASSILMRITIR